MQCDEHEDLCGHLKGTNVDTFRQSGLWFWKVRVRTAGTVRCRTVWLNHHGFQYWIALTPVDAHKEAYLH